MTEQQELTAAATPRFDPVTDLTVGRQRAILDAMDDVMLVFDPVSLVIDDANAAAIKLLDRPRGAIVGVRFDSLLRPSDVPRVADALDVVRRDGRRNAVLVLSFAIDQRRSQDLEILLRRVEVNDRDVMIVAIGHDIHERVQAQVRLQRVAQAEHARAAELNAVIQAMGESVVVCSADGSITLSNPAADDLFPDVEERSYAEILAQLDDPAHTAPSLGIRGGPVQIQTRDDPDRWIELATYPVAGTLGISMESDETIVVMRDVTEARRRELVRETFVGVLSHELRTPITTIYGGAKLLAREDSTLDDKTRREILADIHHEAERLQRLVEDIVALNRFGESPGEIVWEPVLLQRLIPRVVRSEEGRWPGIRFEERLADDIATVSADPTYVEQVLRNLLSNAAKYGGSGSTVTIVVEGDASEVTSRGPRRWSRLSAG